ncbi:MAG: hypothetical protein HY927_13305 [Elusimicrobia bacterium]|nr:hypothetical protein [Elusimicrobiota bacterium]
MKRAVGVPNGVSAQPLLVLATTGAFGFILGVLRTDWQNAAEGAQAISGLLKDPISPFVAYYAWAWTSLHQVPALLLRAGLSEWTVSVLLSGLAGALCFQALGLVVWALCRDPLFSVLAPIWIAFASDPSPGFLTFPGINYDAVLLGSPSTGGMYGTSLALLVFGCVGAELYGPAVFILGLSLCVHPVLALWCHLALGAALLWDRDGWRPIVRSCPRWALAGYGLSLLSFVSHHGLARQPMTPVEALHAPADYATVFIRYWDHHRRPVPLSTPGVVMAALNAVLGAVCLKLYRPSFRRGPSLMLGAFLASAVLAGPLILCYRIPPDWVPGAVWKAMPARTLNLNVLGLSPLLLGLLWLRRDDSRAMANLLATSALLILLPPSHRFLCLMPSALSLLAVFFLDQRPTHRRFWSWSGAFCLAGGVAALLGRSLHPGSSGRYSVWRLTGAVAFLAAGLAAAWRATTVDRTSRIAPSPPQDSSTSWAVSPLARGTVLAVSAILCVPLLRDAWRSWVSARAPSAVFAEASRRNGSLLTGSNLSGIQMRTRRPVLLDGGGFDWLPYNPGLLGPSIDRILREIYGVSFFEPPDDIRQRRPGGLLSDTGRQLWSSRSPREWARIRRDFGVTDVITFADWELRIPLLARDSRHALYSIPEHIDDPPAGAADPP